MHWGCAENNLCVCLCVCVCLSCLGATLGKGLNRGLATLSAGALGVGALHLSSLFENEGKPIVLAILVFLLGRSL